ncbi:MAG: hypothetical protein ISS47_05875 [Candidatus Omnitrophica bacterium]|nr:hypothetical protein [Candidatus Omnitrophota bacterium]
MIRRFLILIHFVIVVAISFDSFAQEKSTFRSFLPVKQGQSNLELEKEISLEEDIVNAGFSDTFEAYRVVREENLFNCHTDGCKAMATALLRIRYIGEGRCDKVKSSICEALKKGNCSLVTESERNLCKSMLEGDINLFTKNFVTHISKGKKIKNAKADASLSLAIYHGFRNYSLLACERYLNNSNLPLSDRLSCRLIFSSSFEEERDRAVRGLAIFTLSRKKNNLKLCNLIKIEQIKNACLNSRIKDIADIW